MPLSFRGRGWWSFPLLLAGVLLAATAQAAGTGAQDERGKDGSLDVLLDAITEVHEQRTQLLDAEALPGNSPPPGDIHELLPVAHGRKVSAQEQAIGALLMAEIGAGVQSAQKAD
ncbi:MAG TPA: hypothetical protein VK913_04755 [Erythrobacter sp.]|nr:hypothetical protein [Erythrobacter sp.]